MDDDKRSMDKEKDRAKQEAAEPQTDAGSQEDTASGGAPEEPDK